jgi:hypothetical protein
MELPLTDRGPVTYIELSLLPQETVTFETPGSAARLQQGWGMFVSEGLVDAIGGITMFRQRVEGRPDFEASVPLNTLMARRAILPFDQSEAEAGVAICNIDDVESTVTLTFRDRYGRVQETKKLTMGAFAHRTLVLSNEMAASKGKNGSLDVTTTGLAVAVMGVRFNPTGPFTSTPAFTYDGWW